MQDEHDTGDKNKVEGVVQKCLVFFKKNLNKIAEFRSEELLEENNVRDARERRYNQLNLQNQTNSSSAK